MKAEIKKSRAEGSVYAPPSKSVAHRLLIAAALADGTSKIKGISECDDVLATADCLRALGAVVERCGADMTVTGFDPRRAKAKGLLDCRESGSTLRFIFPIALLSGDTVRFCGAKRLLERPLGVYEDICRAEGINLSRGDGFIEACGVLDCNSFSVRGDISSQFISGLLFSAPFMKGDVRIHITTKIESRSYIDLTLDAMSSFGVSAVWENDSTLFVKGGQKYRPADLTVEGDYSAAPFIDALNLFGGEVELLGLRSDSLQGDRVYREHFKELKSGFAKINLEDCPDLAPILFTASAALHGARFVGTARLKIKESDRAAVMAEELSKFGAKISVYENSVEVSPAELHEPREVLLSHNDHRVVMSLATLASIYGGVIIGAEAVKKSYPDYFSDIISLGIDVKCYED
ncbi:MAG: 3-phosphoshikimate 1-carboxyvinyltransferase [Clostridia bacterium]|nr:3-phosphoshikimate 1-carboxyvinyltransferase [Clostridia bacterium]